MQSTTGKKVIRTQNQNPPEKVKKGEEYQTLQNMSAFSPTILPIKPLNIAYVYAKIAP